jgi:(p)ppGpp synthase/HD superfamily hydrolase
MNSLLQIEGFASKAHAGQKRKFEDAPYIVHPVRVMNICKEYTRDPTILGAALLHDVLEDTTVTKSDLLDFLLTVFPVHQAEMTAALVEGMTDVFTKKNYPAWNRRKRKNYEAKRLAGCNAQVQTIKYADIIDNSLTIITCQNDFARKYLQECNSLLNRMNRGNAILYQRALATVAESLLSLDNMDQKAS